MMRGLVGALVAGLVTARGRATGSLSPKGQASAFLLGVLATAAGWGFAASLVTFYVAAEALTRWRAEEKARRTIAAVPQTAERNSTQVFANGAFFTAFALYALHHPNPRWRFAALGALAAASADTWATEVGTFLGNAPRSVVTWSVLAPGMSGGISGAGTLASVGGALLVAITGAFTADLRDWRAVAVLTLAGVLGALADSVAGATVQSKRWCDRCREWTERRVHPCGYRTKHRLGMVWLTNDLVNFICTASGAVAAIVLARLFYVPS